jgi:hypothetical protein
VSDALGLLLFAVYCVAVIGVAAGITWIVVRYTPTQKSQ